MEYFSQLSQTVSSLIIPDSLVLDFTSWIHEFEEWNFPMPSPNTIMWGAVVGIPMSILAHDTSSYWLRPSFSTSIPVLSWFQRRWKKSEKIKSRDLHLIRDGVIFLYIAATLYEGQVRNVPMDYVADRLVNASTRAIITREMQSKRSSVFSAAQSAVVGGAGDPEKVTQMRETAMRRRTVQENIQA